jgi:hypothetical protein
MIGVDWITTSLWSKTAALAGLRCQISEYPLTLLFDIFDHFSKITYLTCCAENHKRMSACRCGQLSAHPVSTTTVGEVVRIRPKEKIWLLAGSGVNTWEASESYRNLAIYYPKE